MIEGTQYLVCIDNLRYEIVILTTDKEKSSNYKSTVYTCSKRNSKKLYLNERKTKKWLPPYILEFFIGFYNSPTSAALSNFQVLLNYRYADAICKNISLKR